VSVRIIVTGSRDFTDEDLVNEVLSDVFERFIDHDITIVHGGAVGADALAGRWASHLKKYGVREEVHPAEWGTYGRGAGPIRNAAMVQAGADLVVAFYRDGSGNRGTQNCVDHATLAHIPVEKYTQQ
jgi:hypothetical protein